MSISAEQIRMFYEISLSIGTSLDMNSMLEAFLPTFLERLDCSCGVIIRLDTQGKNGGAPKQVYAIPPKPENDAACRAALDALRSHLDGGRVSRLRKRFHLSERCTGGNFYHILDLPGFGFLILIKNCADLDPLIIKSLTPLLVKLAASCLACLKDEALKVSESKYRSVVEQSTENIFLVDLESKAIIEMNDALRKLLGYTRKEMIKLTVYDFIAHPKENIDAKINLVLNKGKVFVGERNYRCKDGSLVDVEVGASTVTYGDKKALCVVSRDITDRKRAEEQIKASLKQKEVLLQEIHHRVKNNMQIMMSLLRLQTEGVDNPVMQEKIREYSNRIQTMSLIHQKLYQTKNFSEVNFGEYILTLVNQLFKVYSVPPDKIRVVPDLQDVILDVKQAIPCGLLVNELISNVLKHAFPHEKKGEMLIELSRMDDGRTSLQVRDTGVGVPPDFDIKTSDSLGMQLIDDLTMEIGGVMELDHSRGCCFKILF
jgi:PAS domain S-box-containing protein